MKLKKKEIKKIRGDASHREFYRKKNKFRNSIIVYTKKEKEKNLLIYDCINKILLKNKILAPELYSQNYEKNYIEIQDFGDQSMFIEIKKNKKNRLHLFKKIILLLIDIQKIKEKKSKNFNNKNYQIPIYKKRDILMEAELFCDWYVPDVIHKEQVKDLNKKIKKEIKLILSNIKLKNNFFVHRDFHVSNLMLFKNKIGVIDSQDALIGNISYDLASLIDDVRLKTSKKLKNSIYRYYLASNKKKFNKNFFKNDFEILSILRNLKIIGIFTRLANRDKKKNI